MLELHGVTVRFGQNTVIENLDFSFPERKTTALTGVSGIGKTTILNLLAGLVKPSEGRVHAHGGTLAFVFQDPRLFPWMNAFDNVFTVCKNKETAEHYLSVLGLADSLRKFPDELSGGMRQRVAVARALSVHPDVLLLDEPFKGLDPETKKLCAELIFRKTQNKTVIFVTHDYEELKYADFTASANTSPITFLDLAKSSKTKNE